MASDNSNNQKNSGSINKMTPVTRATQKPDAPDAISGVVEKKIVVETPAETKEDEKPAEAAAPAPVVKPAPVVAKPTTVAESKVVTQLSEFLARYKANLDTRKPTIAQQKAAADYFSKAILLVLSNPSDDVFDALWNFFKVNANGLMREDRALQGITSLEKRNADVVMVVYNAFRFYTGNGNIKPDNAVIMRTTRSQRMISYLQRKVVGKI